MRFTPLKTLVASITILQGIASGAIVLTTSQTYDAATNANAVDSVAGFGSVGVPAAATELANYSGIFSTAYLANTGGVITFDNIAMSSTDIFDPVLSVSYGAGASNTLTITTSTNYGDYQIQSAAVVGTPISGGTYLRVKGGSVSGGTGFQTFNFSSSLSNLAFTVLTRTDASRSITATVTFDDNSTAFLTDTVTGSGTPNDDTFFGFTAPEGRTIKSLVISAGSGSYFAIDDLAFVVAIPEPSTVLLGLLGSGLMFVRRRKS